MSALQLAALLIVITGVAHSVLGERYILVRLLRRDDLPKLFGDSTFTARTLRFAWHITTIAWWGIALVLWQASTGSFSEEAVLTVLGWTSILSAVLPLVVTRGKHLSWIVFLAVGILVLRSAAA